MRPPLRRAVLFTITASLAACGAPTDAVPIPVHWATDTATVQVSTQQFLSDIELSSSGIFRLSAHRTGARTMPLYTTCGPCSVADGSTIAKPEFVASAQLFGAFPPSGVIGASINGQLELRFTNRYAFDPLRPEPGRHGTIVVDVFQQAGPLGRLTISGATQALPPGKTLTTWLPLGGTIGGLGAIVITVRMESPAGDPVPMSADQGLDFVFEQSELLSGAVTVLMSGRELVGGLPLDFGGLAPAHAAAADSALIRVKVLTTLFDAERLHVSLNSATGTLVSRALERVGTGSDAEYVGRVGRAELQALAGRTVDVHVSAPTGYPAALTVQPNQVIRVRAAVEVFAGG